MALFGGSRDISLFNSISKELINDIIQTEVGYYKFVLEKTSTNVYGESKNKVYYELIGVTQKKYFEIEGEMKTDINDLFKINNQWYNNY